MSSGAGWRKRARAAKLLDSCPKQLPNSQDTVTMIADAHDSVRTGLAAVTCGVILPGSAGGKSDIGLPPVAPAITGRQAAL
jgi:hypothetical protein